MRIEYLTRLIQMMDTDAILICPGEELLFFTGFTPMLCERFQGLFIKRNGSMFFVTNVLYEGEYRKNFGADIPLFTWHDNEGMDKVYYILREHGIENCTLALGSTVQTFNILPIAENNNIRIKDGKALFEEIRIRKSSEELDLMRKSAEIADSVYDEICKFICPGLTEGQILDKMISIMNSYPDSVSYGGIVASGSNSGYPHYGGTSRIIEEGDCIILDYGTSYKGMLSDMSRTVFVGSITDEQRQLYELVNRAQIAGEAAAKEGAWIPEIDKTSRAVLDEMGVAHTLVNRVGHGIGFSIHEGPYITQKNLRHLERGMCFSIEPGVYFPGKYGIRIENIVCINENGETESLNKADRSIRIIDWYKS